MPCIYIYFFKEECKDDLNWIDDKHGSGTSSCSDVANNPTWCTDYGTYSVVATKACPVACGVCSNSGIKKIIAAGPKA